MTDRLAELDTLIAAMGRPRIEWVPQAAWLASQRAIKEWEAANPGLVPEWRRLAEERAELAERTEAQRKELERAERALAKAAGRLESSGVGHRSLDAAANARETEALAATRRWLGQREKSWLILCGEKGTGKSVAATWALRECIRNGGHGAFRRVSEVCRMSAFEEGARDFEALKRADLLVLDDWGTESAGDYARERLHELCDVRHEEYARTIITSNLRWHPGKGDPQGLKGRIGERLADRISEAGTLIQLTGQSLRRPGKSAGEGR